MKPQRSICLVCWKTPKIRSLADSVLYIAGYPWGPFSTALLGVVLLLMYVPAFAVPVPIIGPQRVGQPLGDLPYRHCGLIKSAAGDGSGSVVYDKRLILTAAHVVCDPLGRLDIHGATWHLRYNAAIRPLAGGKAIRGAWVFLGQGYAGYDGAISQAGTSMSQTYSRDIAVCIAPQPGNGVTENFSDGTLPWQLNFRLPPLLDYAANPTFPKTMIGYGSHRRDWFMYQTVAVDDIYTDAPSEQPVDSSFRFVSNPSWISPPSMFASKGMSGGPLLVMAAGEQAVVGILIAGSGGVLAPGEFAKVSKPGARMLTQEVVDQLMEPAKKAANARITSQTAVSWPVGQQSTWQLEIAPVGDFIPTTYHAEGMPSWMSLLPSQGGLPRLLGTPPAPGTAEVTLFARDELHDAKNHPAGWVPTVADPGCSLYVKIKFVFGQVPACGDQATATFRYTNKDCNAAGSQILSYYKDSSPPGSRLTHEFCDGTPLTSSNTGFFFSFGSRGAPLPIRKTTRVTYLKIFDEDPDTESIIFTQRLLGPAAGLAQFEDGASGSTSVNNGDTKDFLELIYDGSDLDYIEILGPDKVRVPTIDEFLNWSQDPVGTPNPSSTFHYVKVHYEDGSESTLVPGLFFNGVSTWTAGDSLVTVPPAESLSQAPKNFGHVTHAHIQVNPGDPLPPPFTLTVRYYDGERERTASKTLEYVGPDTPNLPDSQFSLSSYYETAGPEGRQITVQVTATAGKPWSALSQVPWITIVSGGSGSGSGTVVLQVAANAVDYGRSGTVRIGNKELDVDQGFLYEPPAIQPETLTPQADGGAFTVSVNASSNTAWSVYSLTNWISVFSSTFQQGNAQITIQVSPNTGPARTGTLQVGGTVCTVNQAAGSGSAADISVEQPAGTSLVAGTALVNFGNVNVGQIANLTFTIRNTGNASLTGVLPILSGGNIADFAVTTAPGATLAAGISSTCVIRFKPIAPGARSTTLRIPSNDIDETPFDITLVGMGNEFAAPQITQQLSDQTVGAGQSASFSTAASGSPTLVYNWQFLPVVGGEWVGLSGSGSTLTIPNAQLVDAGQYRVIVSNGISPNASSNIVTLAVVPPTNYVPPSAVSFAAASSVLPEDDRESTISLILDHTSSVPISVLFAYSGTGTLGADFGVNSGSTVLFAPGETIQSIVLSGKFDRLLEGVEELTFSLTSPSNAILGKLTYHAVKLADAGSWTGFEEPGAGATGYSASTGRALELAWSSTGGSVRLPADHTFGGVMPSNQYFRLNAARANPFTTAAVSLQWLNSAQKSALVASAEIRTFTSNAAGFEAADDLALNLEGSVNGGMTFSTLGPIMPRRAGGTPDNLLAISQATGDFVRFSSVTGLVGPQVTHVRISITGGNDSASEFIYVDNLSIGVSGASTPATDSDGDGQTDSEEAIAGTNPSDRASMFRLLGIGRTPASPNSFEPQFSAVIGKVYQVEYSATLDGSWSIVMDNYTASASGVVAPSVVLPSGPKGFLRVRVKQ